MRACASERAGGRASAWVIMRTSAGSVRSWRQFPGRVAAREACPQGPHQNLPRFMKTVIKVRGASSVPEQGRAQYRKQRFFPIERNRLHELDTPPLAPTHLRSKRNGGCCNGHGSPTPLNPTSDRNFTASKKNRGVSDTGHRTRPESLCYRAHPAASHCLHLELR